MESAILAALALAISSSAEARHHAEAELERLAASPEYPASLCRILLARELALPTRQLAAMVLKTYVKRHWTPLDGDHADFLLDDQYKVAVRSLLVQALPDPSPRIRAVAAYLVATIASFDWPEDWPDLFPILLEHLHSNDPVRIHGTMRCLSEFSACITDQHLEYVVPPLFPQLLTIFRQPAVYSETIRARAVQVIRNCVEVIAMVSEDDPDRAQALLAPTLPAWLEALALALDGSGGTGSSSPLIVRVAALETVAVLITSFAALVAPYAQPLLGPVWHALAVSKDSFVAQVVNQPDAETVAQDSDGNALGPEAVVYALFSVVLAMAEKKAFRPILAPSLPRLVYLVIGYMQLSEAQIETWVESPDQYIADEEEDMVNYNVRDAGQRLLVLLNDHFKSQSAAALAEALTQHLAEASAMQQAGSPHWWKPVEASYVALTIMSRPFVRQCVSAKIAFDWRAFVTNAVLPNARQADIALLSTRALRMASVWLKRIPTDLADLFVQTALDRLDPRHPSLVRIGSMRAISLFCGSAPDTVLRPHVPALLGRLVGLLSGASKDVVMLVLETIISAITVDRASIASYEPTLGPLVLTAWAAYTLDPFVMSAVEDLCGLLCSIPESLAAFRTRALPSLVAVLGAPTQQDAIVLTSAMALFLIVAKQSSTMPPGELSVAFGTLLHTLLTDGVDGDILQNGTTAAVWLLSHNMDALSAWQDAHGQNSASLLMRLVAKLLLPTTSETVAFSAGHLISKLIRMPDSQVQDVLPQLLEAIARRLVDAKLSSFIQALVVVFARLVIRNASQTIDFLHGLPLGDRTALAAVLSVWATNSEFFYGRHTNKVCGLALIRLFQTLDTRLLAIQVQQAVVDTTPEIVTRSKAKQGKEIKYALVPFPAKVVKILLGELQAIESDAAAATPRRARQAAPAADESGDPDYVDVEDTDDDDDDDSEGDDDDDDEDDDDDGEDGAGRLGIYEDDEETNAMYGVPGAGRGKSPFAPAEDYGYLADALYCDNDLDDDESDLEDDDLKQDPRFAPPLEDHVRQFVREVLGTRPDIAAYIQPYLTPAEAAVLRRTLKSGRR